MHSKILPSHQLTDIYHRSSMQSWNWREFSSLSSYDYCIFWPTVSRVDKGWEGSNTITDFAATCWDMGDEGSKKTCLRNHNITITLTTLWNMTRPNSAWSTGWFFSLLHRLYVIWDWCAIVYWHTAPSFYYQFCLLVSSRNKAETIWPACCHVSADAIPCLHVQIIYIW